MKKYFLFAAMAALLLSSCTTKNEPVQTENMFITSFETVDNLIGLTRKTAKNTLVNSGWTYDKVGGDTIFNFTKEANSVVMNLEYDYGYDNEVYKASLKMTARNIKTCLKDSAHFKNFMKKLGYAYTLSAGKTCEFVSCAGYSASNYKEAYNNFGNIFTQSSFTANWMSDDSEARIIFYKENDCEFEITVYDYNFIGEEDEEDI